MSEVKYDPVEPLRMAWIEANIDKLDRQAIEIEDKLYGRLPVVDKEQRKYLKDKLDAIYKSMGLVIDSCAISHPKPLDEASKPDRG